MAVKVGLKMAYHAKIMSDVKGSITYADPVTFEKIQQVQVKPKVNRVQVPADDIIDEDISSCLGGDITVQKKNLTLEEESELLGRLTDGDGGIYGGEADDPPYEAFGYMRTLSDNSGLFVWLLKTRFAPTDSTAETKEPGSVKPQYDSLTASAITRVADGNWIYSRRSNDPNFASTFFTRATLEKLAVKGAVSAITISSVVPADGATDVAKNSNIVITFNNKIVREDIILISASGDIVPVSKAFDATGKILTITPSSALSATTKYVLSITGVTDEYGQSLAATTKDFTTIA